MTQKEKIDLLKSTITFLYEKEGRSKSYISKLLEVDRKVLTNSIKEWNLIKANSKRLSPANQKFANKHRQFIKSKLDQNVSQIKIAEALNVSRDYLRNIIEKDNVLSKANEDYINRIKTNAEQNKQNMMDKSSLEYLKEDLPGEEWKEILGYNDYYVSNKGRIKHYIKRYNSYALLKPNINYKTNRYYIKINGAGLSIPRLVGFAFVDGYSEENNTIDHIDGDVSNNSADNLEWVSQAENNRRSFDNNPRIPSSYSNKKFKKIVLDDKYEFKTKVALAKFLNKSVTQINRYITGECNSPHNFRFVY